MHRALYAAFDRVPSRKGAAVHIERFASTLFDERGGGLLYVLAPEGAPLRQEEAGVEVVRFGEPVEGVMRRARAFGRRLGDEIERHERTLEVCHFRDPWSGLPVVSRPRRRYSAVYEVNGLPSIEMPARRPGVPRRAVARLRALEQMCLDRADRVVVPSPLIAEHVHRRGVPEDRVTVIPNGADVAARPERPPGAPERYAIYFGAFQPWQGVDTMLRAFTRLRDLDLPLVAIAARRDKFTRRAESLAERLGLDLLWHYELTASELRPWVAHALVSLAPLGNCARNTSQGCAPLKVLESMAAGVPLVASDLRVVRDLVADGEHGLLVPPDRPAELARAVRMLAAEPERAAAMGAAGRERVAGGLTWRHATDRLRVLYRSLPSDG